MSTFSVSGFIEFVNSAFSSAVFPGGVSIEGEISDYRVSQGKWIWFQLKDEESIVSCFSMTFKLRQELEDGMQVKVIGTPKIFNRSGKFSITVDRVELVGEGALKRQFELLRKKLETEGLFDIARKRALPEFPARIGVITSREAAAYTDFLRILGNRWGGVEVQLAHVAVQGRDAVEDIVGAFRWFNEHPDAVDVIVLTRGGGSLEDLQAFNAEDVARAVFSSRIPVVVGVGHERDETLVDFVADVRASTPSNAAEIIVPDRVEVLREISYMEKQMADAIEDAVQDREVAIERMTARLELSFRSVTARFTERLRDFKDAFLGFERRLERHSERTARLTGQMLASTGYWVERLRADIQAKQQYITGADPRHLLAKGYAIVSGARGVLRDASTVSAGDMVTVRLHKGTLETEVKKTS